MLKHRISHTKTWAFLCGTKFRQLSRTGHVSKQWQGPVSNICSPIIHILWTYWETFRTRPRPYTKWEALAIWVPQCISFETKQQQSCRQNIFLPTSHALTVVYNKRNNNKKIMLTTIWFGLQKRQGTGHGHDWAIILHTSGTASVCPELTHFHR